MVREMDRYQCRGGGALGQRREPNAEMILRGARLLSTVSPRENNATLLEAFSQIIKTRKDGVTAAPRPLPRPVFALPESIKPAAQFNLEEARKPSVRLGEPKTLNELPRFRPGDVRGP